MVKVSQVLKELQAKIAILEARNQELEARIDQLEHPRKPAVSALAPAVPAAPPEEPVSEEVMLVIAAAVAAYLGERAHIRVVRLAPSHAWAQQGRVSIQASHRLAL
jgi:methylmalonyl-CoA carboxyltransferase large subunit